MKNWMWDRDRDGRLVPNDSYDFGEDDVEGLNLWVFIPGIFAIAALAGAWLYFG